MKALLLILAAASATTSKPAQFDLVCSDGRIRFDLLDEYKPWPMHLRIDLAAMKWCEDPPPSMSHITPCAVLHPVARAEPGVIFLDEATPEEKALGITRSQSINRQTGSYSYYSSDPRRHSVIDAKATCEPAPFSGFPKIETKF